jgi:hypothetical protein
VTRADILGCKRNGEARRRLFEVPKRETARELARAARRCAQRREITGDAGGVGAEIAAHEPAGERSVIDIVIEGTAAASRAALPAIHDVLATFAVDRDQDRFVQRIGRE